MQGLTPGLTPGRIVHYVSERGTHFAAIVTQVANPEAGKVVLTIFRPFRNPQPMARACRYSGGTEPDTWHWVEKA